MISSLNQKREFSNDNPRIKIIGVGGAGTNIVGSLFSKNVLAELISVNTDWKQLSLRKADQKILIGFDENRGLGCGGDVAMGKQSARENMKEIRAALQDTELIIFVGGLGKGTCTGALPEIAQEARKKGALVVAFLTIPFFMRGASIEKTRYALDRLEDSVDSLILIDNNKLMELYKNLSFLNSLAVIDELILRSVSALIQLIRENELIEVDYSNLKSVLKNGKLGTIGIAEVDTPENIDQLVKECAENNLIVTNPKKAAAALVQVIGDSTLTLRILNDIMNRIKNRIEVDADVVISAKIDESMKGKIRLVLLLVGMDYGELKLKNEIIGLGRLLEK